MQHDATLDGIKDSQRRHWNAVAGGWARWIEWTERNFDPITRWFREVGVWRPRSRILDLACGAGYPALAAAATVRPHGRVVATDISPEMVAATARRAAALGLDNIECREMDAERVQLGDASVDAVTSAYGLMFCPSIEKALSEAHRVLRPGGQLALVTWDAPAKSPFFATMLPLAGRFLALQPPAPDAPGPFRLSDAAALESMLRRTGFDDIRIERRSMLVTCTSPAEYVQIFVDIAWKARIASLSATETARFSEAVVDATRPNIEEGELRLIASSLCASAFAAKP